VDLTPWFFKMPQELAAPAAGEPPSSGSAGGGEALDQMSRTLENSAANLLREASNTHAARAAVGAADASKGKAAPDKPGAHAPADAGTQAQAVPAIGVSASASGPNILSAAARTRLVVESERGAKALFGYTILIGLAAGLASIIGDAVGAHQAAAALASNWYWPIAFGMVGGTVLWIIAYFTVMGFSRIGLNYGLNIPGGSTSPAGGTDTGKPDTGKPDTGKPDTGKPDTGKPDTGKPDTTPSPPAGA
jgi:hypothetical protein